MIYLLLLLFIVIGIYHFDFKNNKYLKKEYFLFISLLLILISGLSYRLGGDVIVYMREYELYSGNFSDLFNLQYLRSYGSYMPGWVFINTLFQCLGLKFWTFKLCHAFFINIVLLFIVKKYSKYTFLGVLLYLLLLYYDLNFEVLRESISVSFFLMGIPYLLQRKYMKFYIFCLCAILFHISASFLVFFPLVLLIPINLFSVVFFMFVAFFALLLDKTVSSAIVDSVSSIPFFYEKANSYFSNERYGTSIVSISRLINILFNVVFTLFVLYRLYKKNIVHGIIKLVLAYICIYTLTLIIPIFYRLNNYCIIFFVCYLTFLPVYFKLEFKRSLSNLICSIFFVLFISFKLYSYSLPIGDTTFRSYIRFYPYSSIFEKSLDLEREKYHYY